jgi:hypothetical protein
MHALKQEKEERSKDREIRQRDENDLGHMASSGSTEKLAQKPLPILFKIAHSGGPTLGVGPTGVVHDAMDK